MNTACYFQYHLTLKVQSEIVYLQICELDKNLKARKNENGELVLYENQDENLWNKDLIQEGIYFLISAASSSGEKLIACRL